jgi:hypothetical protein
MRYINLVLFVGMIVMNYLANALPLNNKTTGELSDSFPNLFVPAGITFSIWGIIYLLLLIYCVVQFTGSNQIAISKISLVFGISCILNAFWIITWHYGKLPLSLLVMVGMLVSLIYINMAIEHLPFGIIKAAFGVYLGWICIATIANVTALLVKYNWNGFGASQETWTIIMIAIGVLLVSLTIHWHYYQKTGRLQINSDNRSCSYSNSIGCNFMGILQETFNCGRIGETREKGKNEESPAF